MRIKEIREECRLPTSLFLSLEDCMNMCWEIFNNRGVYWPSNDIFPRNSCHFRACLLFWGRGAFEMRPHYVALAILELTM